MARQEKKTYELSDAEQRDLMALIQQGKAAAGEIPLHPVRGQARGRAGLERQDPRRLHDRPAVPDAGTHRRAARRNEEHRTTCSTAAAVNCAAGRTS